MVDPNPRPVGCGRLLLYAFVVVSFCLNLMMCIALGLLVPGQKEEMLAETTYAGDRQKSKIAIVRIEGVLMEGAIDYAVRQIEQVSKDADVPAVVLRIDSPGGTISASEVLHRAIAQMAKGTHRFDNKQPKKLVVSMGGIAASGGYYIAMPGDYVMAEKYCITGSIGVYASLPNVAELGKKYGVKMELVKAGDIKASGSPFHDLTPAERQPWQEMVDNAYDQFLDVVVAGRPKLTKAKMTEVLFQKEVPERDDKGNVVADAQGKPKLVKVQRKRADGGTFTAAQAIEYGLIDEVGTLDQAIEKAAALAELTSYRVVKFQKPGLFWNDFIGLQSKPALPGAEQLSNLLTPRGWFLMPGSELGVIVP